MKPNGKSQKVAGNRTTDSKKKTFVKKSRPKTPLMSGEDKNARTIYASNLSYERDRAGLKELFNQYGKILNVKIIIDLETRKSKGMAFIELDSVLGAKKAIKEMNGKKVDGRTLKVSTAKPQKDDRKPFIDIDEDDMKEKDKKVTVKKTTRTPKALQKTSLELMFESISRSKKNKVK